MNKVDEANDWDLQAIIRGWTREDRRDETNTPKVVDMQPSFGNLASLDFHRQYDPVDQEASFVISNELQEVHRPLPSDSVQSSSAVIDRMKTEPQSTVATEAHPRRRKNEQPSEVMHQESKDGVLPLDEWNWRKYGQKPIKGSFVLSEELL